MPVFWTPSFQREWKKLPRNVKTKTKKVIKYLEMDRSHPSLRLKKLQGQPGYWELRVDDTWRIILIIKGDVFTFVVIGSHDVLDRFK